MIRTRIKFCGFVRPEDVEDAVSMGVDAIGFVFYPKSARFVTADAALTLRRRLPSFVAAVGLVVNEPDESLRAIHKQVGLDVIQFHGDETPEQCGLAAQLGLPYWRAVRMRGPHDVGEADKAHPHAEALLLDAYSEAYGGSGHAFDWTWAQTHHKDRRIILSGGLAPDSMARAIAQVSPYAVDVSTGIQGADARRKDRAKMADFVTQVLAADAARAGLVPGESSSGLNRGKNQST